MNIPHLQASIHTSGLQQQIRQQALSALQASIEEELQPQRKQLREQALAAMESEVTSSLQV